jgi:hypothetical protein
LQALSLLGGRRSQRGLAAEASLELSVSVLPCGSTKNIPALSKVQTDHSSFFLYREIRGDKIYLISNYTHPTCENPSSMYSPKITKNYKAKKELSKSQWHFDLCGGRFRAPP